MEKKRGNLEGQGWEIFLKRILKNVVQQRMPVVSQILGLI